MGSVLDQTANFEHWYSANRAKELYGRHVELAFECEKKLRKLAWERNRAYKALEKDVNLFLQKRERLQQWKTFNRTSYTRPVRPTASRVEIRVTQETGEGVDKEETPPDIDGDENPAGTETDEVSSLSQSNDNPTDPPERLDKRRLNSIALALVTPRNTERRGSARYASPRPFTRCVSAPLGKSARVKSDRATRSTGVPCRMLRPTSNLIEHHNAHSEVLASRIDSFLESIDDFTSLPVANQVAETAAKPDDDDDDVKQTKLNVRLYLRTPMVLHAPRQDLRVDEDVVAAASTETHPPNCQKSPRNKIPNDVNTHRGVYLSTPSVSPNRSSGPRRSTTAKKKKCLSAREPRRRVTTDLTGVQIPEDGDDGPASGLNVNTNQFTRYGGRILKSREQRRALLLNAWDEFRADADVTSFRKLKELVAKEKSNKSRRLKSAFY